MHTFINVSTGQPMYQEGGGLPAALVEHRLNGKLAHCLYTMCKTTTTFLHS